jgi:hypothetical protein
MIVAVEAAASGNRAVMDTGAATTVVMAVAASVAIAAIRIPGLRTRVEHAVAAVMNRSPWLPSGTDGPETLAAVRRFIDQLRSYRPAATEVGFAVSAGVLNWAADAMALALAIRSVGGHVSFADVIVVWAVAGTATSFALTPSGVGIVEAVLVTGLVLTGLPRPSAVAATVLYRTVSLLLPVSVGWIAQLSLGRARAIDRPDRSWPGLEAAEPAPTQGGHLVVDVRPPTGLSASARPTVPTSRRCRARRALWRPSPPPRIANASGWVPETSASNVTVASEQQRKELVR